MPRSSRRARLPERRIIGAIATGSGAPTVITCNSLSAVNVAAHARAQSYCSIGLPDLAASESQTFANLSRSSSSWNIRVAPLADVGICHDSFSAPCLTHTSQAPFRSKRWTCDRVCRMDSVLEPCKTSRRGWYVRIDRLRTGEILRFLQQSGSVVKFLEVG